MGKYIREAKMFLCNKVFLLIVGLTAACSYGFAVTHQTIGVDDTAIPLYFQDGIAPAAGRWCLYLVNKIFFVGDFTPWMVELVSVLLFGISVSLWCVLFYQLIGNRVPIWGYAFFAAIFISCPLISEVFVYYLHNGICIAYGLTAIGLLLVSEAMKKGRSRTALIKYMSASAAVLTVALGFYESFIIVYAMGMLLFYFLLRLERKGQQGQYYDNPFCWAGALAAVGVTAILLRSLILKLVCSIYSLAMPANFSLTYRSVFENTGQTLSDMFMVFKKFLVMYYLNAVCYFPIAVLVAGIAALLIVGTWYAFRKRDVFILLPLLALPMLPVGMLLIEGRPTFYRASQYVPLIGAFAVLLLIMLWRQKKRPRIASGIAILCLCSLLWNQCMEMNQWFYVDYLKYEDAKLTMNTIAYDLKKEYDISKPIIFKGTYHVPYEITQSGYLSFDSPRYQFMKKITDLFDEHLLEKFNARDGRGYVFVETPVDSTLLWGVFAFDTTAGELEKFWRMHGQENLYVERDLDKINEAQNMSEQMPGYPQNGYIRECEEYIIVKIGK